MKVRTAAEHKALKDRARQMYATGLFPKEISIELGIPQKTIERWRREDTGTINDWEQAKQETVALANNALSKTEKEKIIEKRVNEVHGEAISEMVKKRKNLIEQTCDGFDFLHKLTMNELRPVGQETVGTDIEGKAIIKYVVKPNDTVLDAIEKAADILTKIQTNKRKALGMDNEVLEKKEKEAVGEQNFMDKIRTHQQNRGHTPTDPNILAFTRKAQ